MNSLNYFMGFNASAYGHMYSFEVLLALLVWSIFWKGLALWHSGRKGQEWWFIILLVVNTAGILEIIYLFGVAKLKLSTLFSK